MRGQALAPVALTAPGGVIPASVPLELLVTLPIFHGGELNANLAGRRADADLAVSDYNQTVLDAVQQTADAIDALRLLGREQAEQRQAREAIDAAYDLAVRRYRAGLGWATICRC
ncbi:outer membrane protein [Bordetella pertussis]|nr:outer membrane protein [Bordetella pertussis]